MRCECPTIRRCCLCLPLRFGLIGTGYAKLGLDMILLFFFIYEIVRIKHRSQQNIFFGIAILLLLLDLVFSTLLIYGGHMKNAAKLRIFYGYSIFLLVLNILFVIAMVVFNVVIFFASPFLWVLMLYAYCISLAFWTIGIFLHVYLTILVRSEVLKLEDNTQFQFTNDIEGACAMKDPAEDNKQQKIECEVEKD